MKEKNIIPMLRRLKVGHTFCVQRTKYTVTGKLGRSRLFVEDNRGQERIVDLPPASHGTVVMRRKSGGAKRTLWLDQVRKRCR